MKKLKSFLETFTPYFQILIFPPISIPNVCMQGPSKQITPLTFETVRPTGIRVLEIRWQTKKQMKFSSWGKSSVD